MIDLKSKRIEAGYTQEQLAEESGVKRSSIANIECGFNKPSVDLAKKLGEILRFDWVLFYSE